MLIRSGRPIGEQPGLTFLLMWTPPVSATASIGEELGGRGYMLTRLIYAGIPRPVLASGIVWWLFHLAPILAGRQRRAFRDPFTSCPRGRHTITMTAIFADSRSTRPNDLF